jgi:uncharacterized C2H2 Zn-finger protein
MSETRFTPAIRCNECGITFSSRRDWMQHKRDAHEPHRAVIARERPRNRGPIACGYAGCDATFANERNASQHRRSAHQAARWLPIETCGAVRAEIGAWDGSQWLWLAHGTWFDGTWLVDGRPVQPTHWREIGRP